MFCTQVWHSRAKQDEVLRCFAELGAVLKAAERKGAQARKVQAEEAQLSMCSVPRRSSIRASAALTEER